IVFMCQWIPEVDEQSVAQQLGDMSLVALTHLRTRRLIGTDDVPVVFGIELARELGGLDEVTEHDGELPAFGVGGMRGSRWRCDVCGLGVWRKVRLRWWCGEGGRWCTRFIYPHQPSAALIDNLRRGEQDFVFQVVEVGIIEVKAALEGTIGDASLPFQEIDNL